MAYFPNGTAGADYEAAYCSKCVHQGTDEDGGCAIWLAHLLYSYEECGRGSNAAHILDLLIPQSKDGLRNEQCRMFRPSAARARG